MNPDRLISNLESEPLQQRGNLRAEPPQLDLVRAGERFQDRLAATGQHDLDAAAVRISGHPSDQPALIAAVSRPAWRF